MSRHAPSQKRKTALALSISGFESKESESASKYTLEKAS
jgi:hypothetical protein